MTMSASTGAATPVRPRRFRRLGWATVAVLLSGTCAVALMPVTTSQGVNFVVTNHRLPVYAKVLDFIDRDINYGRLAGEVAAGATTDEQRTLAVFDWTRAHVRDTPPDFDVIDDHVWHIVIRGYGKDDQKSDVFVTLLTYAGVRAYMQAVGPEKLVLSFPRVDGRWRVLDVANGIVFRNRSGAMATPEELAADPSLIEQVAAGRTYSGQPYIVNFRGFRAPVPPDMLRAEMQMSIPRVVFQIKRLVGRGGRLDQPPAP